jgi:hypothetical protein
MRASFGERLAQLHAGSAPSPGQDARVGRLATLRAQLAALTGVAARTGAAAAPPRAPRPSRLPFARERDGAHLRALRFGLGTRVGSVALEAAASADALVLSLLSLTPALAEACPARALFLDVETTGLGGGTGNYAFLVGLAFFEQGALVLEQLFLRDPADEEPMLRRIGERMAAAELWVTFNGKSFDVPLIRARGVMQRLPPPCERPHLDLLHLARRVHRARRFRKALGTLERQVLQFQRGPDVSGAEVAARYAHFLASGDDGELDEVVRHNQHDVLSLVALTGLYGEPLERFDGEELAAAAGVLSRAGELERASAWAREAMRRGASAAGLRARAHVHKARGERALALADFEALCAAVDDPVARLELAKLHEHFMRDPRRALAVVERGTHEDAPARARRRARLQRKLAKLARLERDGDQPREMEAKDGR